MNQFWSCQPRTVTSSSKSKMRHIAISITVSLGLLFAGEHCSAQSSDTLPKFNTLRTPVSPAFTILGIAPTEIERPQTPSEFTASLLKATSDFTELPTDYSVEVSPYWMRSRRLLTWRTDTTRSILESIQRTLTLSIAAAQVGDSENSATGLGAGVRFSLFSGDMSDESQKALVAAEKLLRKNASLFYEATAQARSAADEKLVADLRRASDTPDPDVRKSQLEAARSEHKAAVELINNTAMQEFEHNEVQNVALQRTGFFLDAALASAWHFGRNDLDSGRWRGYSFWLTPAYETLNLSLVGVGRFTSSRNDSLLITDGDSLRPSDTTEVMYNDGVIDVGARAVYAAGKYALSAEFILRSYVSGAERDSQLRLAVIVDYELQDGLWLTGAFGKNFDDAPGGNLLAKAGLSINLARKRYTLGPKE